MIQQFKIIIAMLVCITPLTSLPINHETRKEMAAQIVMLKQMLHNCNGQYIHNTRPMYQQDLTFHHVP